MLEEASALFRALAPTLRVYLLAISMNTRKKSCPIGTIKTAWLTGGTPRRS